MKKLMNKKGFTLMEMLIVVAIIVILVAISVPTFTANLDESRKAVDDANARAARSAAVIYVMDKTFTAGSVTNLFYDVDAGKIVTSAPSKGYGQSSGNKDKVVKITYTVPAADSTDEASFSAPEWVAKGTTSTTP